MSVTTVSRTLTQSQLGFIYSVISKKVSYALTADKYHHVYRDILDLNRLRPDIEPDDVISSFILYVIESEREGSSEDAQELREMKTHLTATTAKRAFYRFLRRKKTLEMDRKRLEHENSEVIISNFTNTGNEFMHDNISYQELIHLK